MAAAHVAGGAMKLRQRLLDLVGRGFAAEALQHELDQVEVMQRRHLLERGIGAVRIHRREDDEA